MEKRINVTKSSMPSFEEYVEEIRNLWDTRWLTNMGEKHNQLSTSLKIYLGIDNISLLVNGHMALEIGLQALNMKGEVITTPFTFASTTHAIVRSGLKPVFCDIKQSDYTIDVEQIEKLINPNTVAILPVHVYGNVCDVEAIEQIARKYNLKVIYDAAHAFGERYNDRSVLSYGDMSMISFHATKVFHTIEGGAICYTDDKLRDKIDKLRDFGITSEEEIDEVGTNAKMNEFVAAMGICNLRHIDEEIEKRKIVVNHYIDRLSEVSGIVLNTYNSQVKSNYAYFPIYIDESDFGYTRDEVNDRLIKSNIYARKYFYPLTSNFSCYKDKYDSSITPIAVNVSKRILTLPLYADMTHEEVERVCRVILEMKGKKNVK